MIALNNISCGYGKKIILNNISLNIQQGQLTCLLGKNGVGKTTLFKTILGLLPIANGTITYKNKAFKTFSQKEFAKFISYVPQAHGTPFPFKVLDVILMGQHIHTLGLAGSPKKENKNVVMECIKALGIEDLTHKTFSKLSGGQKQMVLIARAMAQQPSFIAMDEPTANLDMGNQIKVMKVAQMLKEKGYGILMNTHSPEHALQYADHVVMLKNGTTVESGAPEKIIQSRSVSELYNTPLELIKTRTSNGQSRRVLVAV